MSTELCHKSGSKHFSCRFCPQELIPVSVRKQGVHETKAAGKIKYRLIRPCIRSYFRSLRKKRYTCALHKHEGEKKHGIRSKNKLSRLRKQPKYLSNPSLQAAKNDDGTLQKCVRSCLRVVEFVSFGLLQEAEISVLLISLIYKFTLNFRNQTFVDLPSERQPKGRQSGNLIR